MVETKLSRVGKRTKSAHSYVETDQNCVLPHLRWELEQVMSRVQPGDLSAAEIAALLAVLIPAHSRVIGGPASRPKLRATGVREHSASNLA
jgi:hypothetical protein